MRKTEQELSLFRQEIRDQVEERLTPVQRASLDIQVGSGKLGLTKVVLRRKIQERTDGSEGGEVQLELPL